MRFGGRTLIGYCVFNANSDLSEGHVRKVRLIDDGVASRAVDLSGMYLSDKQDNPRKWAFPQNTIIPPGGFLIVWADEDEGDGPELHANFRLSGNGEVLILLDTDDRDNRLLDLIEYGKQVEDVSYSRTTDGTGNFAISTATPGRSNR